MSEFERLSSHDLVEFIEEIQLFNELCDTMESSVLHFVLRRPW